MKKSLISVLTKAQKDYNTFFAGETELYLSELNSTLTHLMQIVYYSVAVIELSPDGSATLGASGICLDDLKTRMGFSITKVSPVGEITFSSRILTEIAHPLLNPLINDRDLQVGKLIKDCFSTLPEPCQTIHDFVLSRESKSPEEIEEYTHALAAFVGADLKNLATIVAGWSPNSSPLGNPGNGQSPR